MKKILILVISTYIISIVCISPVDAFLGRKIKTYEIVEQPLNQKLTTNVGGSILTIIIKQDLKNIFGRADIWGGKIEKGYKKLNYMGINPDGTIKLRIIDVAIMTNETTMSRYGVNQSYIKVKRNSSANAYGSLYGNSYSGYGSINSTTTGAITHYPKRNANRETLPPNVVEVNLNLKTNDEFEFINKKIRIFSVTPMNINYIILNEE